MSAFILSAASLNPRAFPGATGTDRMNLLTADHSGASILASACLVVLIARLDAGDVLVGLDSLDALVVLKTPAALNVLDALVRLYAL